ncbi:hypothetical protein XENORESO_001860 [Xenotaenia resolanae]|uniref:Uncharacterized protein n=1 Tax=Xenotaenia resolanae TaxID=208358 RepID=A0ABV0VND7_9TELE
MEVPIGVSRGVGSWESILPPSPSLHMPGHLPPAAPSHCYSCRALGCECVIGVPRGLSISAVPWQPCPQFYYTTYNIFMTFTCRVLGVGALNGIKRECILLTSPLKVKLHVDIEGGSRHFFPCNNMHQHHS